MFIATLLTNPETPHLDRVAVESLRNAWGGGDAIWLDPGVAAEFPVETVPANLWEVWQGGDKHQKFPIVEIGVAFRR